VITRLSVLAIAALLAACGGNQNHPLPMVQDNDPVIHLNPDQWPATGNELMRPPGDGASQPLPPPVLLNAPNTKAMP
jgi:hypothetical protein